MKSRGILLLFLIVLGGARGDPGLEDARHAQALLGPEMWSRLIRVENSRPRRPYPRIVHALVFELAGILWFYTDSDGTQSLSRYTAHAAADEADLGPLLLAIDPGFAAWTRENARPCPATVSLRLPNGCFIQSIALLRARLAQGLSASEPRLLSYYVHTPLGRRGHTVLEFGTADGPRVLDPEWPTHLIRIEERRDGSPLAVAGRLRGDVALARWLPLGDFSRKILLAGSPLACSRVVVS